MTVETSAVAQTFMTDRQEANVLGENARMLYGLNT